ncbi:MAG: 3-keto-disaccharide hydrolase, partial [Planctomycetota bacterium]
EFKEHARGGDRVKGRRTLKLKESSEKPIGQWNAYDIICKDDWVVVLVNGVLQNVATECTPSSGKICLQSEGTPIEYRNVYIEPLE